MNIVPSGAELFHTEGQTEETKLIFAFRNFANEPKSNICTCFSHLSLL